MNLRKFSKKCIVVDTILLYSGFCFLMWVCYFFNKLAKKNRQKLTKLQQVYKELLIFYDKGKAKASAKLYSETVNKFTFRF